MRPLTLLLTPMLDDQALKPAMPLLISAGAFRSHHGESRENWMMAVPLCT